MTGESWKDGKQKQRRALDNGCLACLFIEIKAGDSPLSFRQVCFLCTRDSRIPLGCPTTRERKPERAQQQIQRRQKNVFFFPLSRLIPLFLRL